MDGGKLFLINFVDSAISVQANITTVNNPCTPGTLNKLRLFAQLCVSENIQARDLENVSDVSDFHAFLQVLAELMIYLRGPANCNPWCCAFVDCPMVAAALSG